MRVKSEDFNSRSRRDKKAPWAGISQGAVRRNFAPWIGAEIIYNILNLFIKIAEIFSAVCASLFGLRGVVRRQAGYLDSWKRVLHARPAAILLAASQAQNIVGAILDAACGRQPGLSWLRNRDFSAVPAPLKDDRLRQEAISASLREEMYPERTEEDGPERSPAPGR